MSTTFFVPRGERVAGGGSGACRDYHGWQRPLGRVAASAEDCRPSRGRTGSAADHRGRHAEWRPVAHDLRSQSENWRRPAGEVLDLTGLLRHDPQERDRRVQGQWCAAARNGDRMRFDADIQQDLADAERDTADNARLNLSLRCLMVRGRKLSPRPVHWRPRYMMGAWNRPRSTKTCWPVVGDCGHAGP